MRLLLDSQALIWTVDDRAKLHQFDAYGVPRLW